MIQVGASYTAKGALFRNPRRDIHKVTQRFIQKMVELGEQRLDSMLVPRGSGMGVYLTAAQAKPGQTSTGHYRRNVSGRVSNLRGVITDGKVIYGPWLEGVSSRNQSTRFKGYSSFRKTAQYLQKEVKVQANSFAKKYVTELNKR